MHITSPLPIRDDRYLNGVKEEWASPLVGAPQALDPLPPLAGSMLDPGLVISFLLFFLLFPSLSLSLTF